MSTYQPPGGQPSEGTPTYPQPQDPWAGGQDHGVASVPTDPIPQQYDPYAHGTGSAVWSQPTVSHGEPPYDFMPQPPQRRRTGLIVGLFLVVLVLGGGGGFAAWYITSSHKSGTPIGTATTNGVAPTTAATSPVAFDPHQLKLGDCLVNKGTLEQPLVESSACVSGSFKVIKKIEGASIKENAQGKFDADTTSLAACAGTAFQSWYGYKDAVDEKKDLFFCLTNNK
jgi:hypothetical protein